MSGRKNFLLNYHLITDTSMGSSITSSAFNIQGLDNIGVQFNFTGTPTGTFYVQVSADYQAVNGLVINSGNWNSLTLNPVPAAAGAADSIGINIQEIAFPWMRVLYTRSSSTGTLNTWICGKML